MDDTTSAGETLRQDQAQSESSRRLSGKEGALQDPDAPKIEGYTLTAKLGAGAYGEVWKAWQKRTGKWVAVKVFPRRHGVDWILLQREVERLIKLDKHPNVVGLLDADLTGDPPYFAMELMEGGALTRFVDPAHPATPEQASRWAEQIAAALCYVHSKGVLHCDLKPANVLLDDEGRVRVADFGQSRIASESTGALGTLSFMAPEQALTFRQNEQLCPDVRWDLFGLGATLYAVLTGRPPHEGALRPELERADGLDARLEAYRNGIRKAAVPEVPVDEDLAAIVRRCLEPWPEKRYLTAGAVIADLTARRECRPVSPLAGDRAYRLRKFVRRNAVSVGLAGVLAVALAAGTSTVFRQNAALEGELANAYALRARAASDKSDDAAAAVLFARANALHPSGLARRSALAHLQALERPLQVWDLGAPVDAVALNEDGTRVVAGGDLDAKIIDAKSGAVLTPSVKLDGMIRQLRLLTNDHAHPAEFSKDGSKALVFSSDGIEVFEAATGKKLYGVSGAAARFSPDGRTIAATGGKGASIRLVDVATGKPTGRVFSHPVGGEGWDSPAFDLSPDGGTLVTALKERLQFYDVAAGRPVGAPVAYNAETSLMISPLEDAVFSPDGRLILSVSWHRAALIDRATGKTIGKVMRHDGNIVTGAFSRDGAFVLTVGEDGMLRRWYARRVGDTEPGQPCEKPLSHGAPISAMALSADGKLVATAGADGVARLWSVSPWGSWGREMLHGSPVLAVAFSGDGKSLVTGGRDGTVRLWRVPGEPSGRTQAQLMAHHVVLSPDSMRMAGEQDGLTILEVPSAKVLAKDLAKGTMGMQEIAYSPDGARLVSIVRASAEAVVWDASGKKLRTISHSDAPSGFGGRPAEIGMARLDEHGKRLLTYSLEAGVRVWDVETGKKLAETKPENFVHDAQFSPDGSRVAIAGEQTEVRDTSLAAPLIVIKHGGGRVAWSPDGARIATLNDEKREVRLWDAKTGAAVGAGVGHEGRITSLQFSRDGAVLATASEDGFARLLDARSGAEIGTPLPHGGKIWAAALSRDASTLATAGMDGTIRFWDTKTGDPVARTLHQGGLVEGLWFSRDGGTLYAAGNWALMAWDVSWMSKTPPPGRLFAAAESLSQRTIGPSGGVVPKALKDWDRGVPAP